MCNRVAVLLLTTLVACWNAAACAGELPNRRRRKAIERFYESA